MKTQIKRIWLLSAILAYLLLTAYQLGLPGLHYDEAKEAGVNAMELLQGQPVTAFRSATISIGHVELPLMVQDYIGALNVYLSLPFLKLTGVGVPNLRFLSILLGLLTLLTMERAISTWRELTPTPLEEVTYQTRNSNPKRISISLPALLAVSLVCASPTFVFWSRQGTFVTNVIQPLSFTFVWFGLLWLRTGQYIHVVVAALAAGAALYGKLLSIWIIAPFALLILGHAWMRALSIPELTHRLWRQCAGGLLIFCIPLLPLLYFNWQTGGTAVAFWQNTTLSYYGVDNRALLENFSVRWSQLGQILTGDHLWYLGASFANQSGPWLFSLFCIIGLVFAPQRLLGWGVPLMASFMMSLFTLSDLFVTHYALLHPFLISLSCLGLSGLTRWGRTGQALIAIFAAVWFLSDLTASLQYHRALSHSGGLADHSDATYHLAYHLQYNGLGAPIALDWGMDAPVRYLSIGSVQPIEIFGYDSISVPDEQFVDRLALFIENTDNVYLLHAPDATIFGGRRELFLSEVEQRGLRAELDHSFAQRDGTTLYELWRVRPKGTSIDR